MKVLLLYPEFPDTFWSFKYALKFIHRKAAYPPLGLITVASMLPNEWEKRLIDLNVERLKDADLKWADYCFISAMAVQRESASQVVGLCKEAGVKVVAGGPLFTAEYEKFPGVDHFVLNEAELTLPPFLRDLTRGRAKKVYKSDQYPDIRKTPRPLWELLKLRRYAAMSIQFSRGCPFNCEFCNVTALFGHKPRIKSAAQILAELNDLYDLGWRDRV
ncbi:MAG TPA: B12-binding domain-containing radical SAM protein, partial [Desulfobacterales bacterium]|nr:B12-binding domain-containing radical SAM protein [Desulfobacterales bacterium]